MNNILPSIVNMIMLFSVVTVLSGRVEAAQMVNIVSNGASSYSVVATDLQDSSGIDLTIKYDALLLGSPIVKAGVLTSSAIMDFNSSTPGQIRLVFITGGAIRGSGELASLSFKAKGGNAPSPVISNIGVYNGNGSQLAVQTASSVLSAENSAGSNSSGGNGLSSGTKNNAGTTPLNSSTSSTVTGTGSTIQSVTTIGSIITPQDAPALSPESAATRNSRRETPVVVAESPTRSQQPTEATNASSSAVYEAKAAGSATASSAEGRHSLKSIQAVIERFRLYKDGRSLKKFMALFDESAAREGGIVQLPAIVVSDGKSMVKLTIDLGQDNDSPSFSLKGANQKSLHRLTDKRWELEVLPQKGKTDVRVSVLAHGNRTEIPLTVVLPLSALGHEILALDEAKLEVLVANQLKNNKPAYDLNGDGKQDYVDDYILTAHWLVKKQVKNKKNVQKPAASGK